MLPVRGLYSLLVCGFQLLQVLCQRLLDGLTFVDMGAQEVHVISWILISCEDIAIGLAWNDFLDLGQRRTIKFCLDSQGAGNPLLVLLIGVNTNIWTQLVESSKSLFEQWIITQPGFLLRIERCSTCTKGTS